MIVLKREIFPILSNSSSLIFIKIHFLSIKWRKQQQTKNMQYSLGAALITVTSSSTFLTTNTNTPTYKNTNELALKQFSQSKLMLQHRYENDSRFPLKSGNQYMFNSWTCDYRPSLSTSSLQGLVPIPSSLTQRIILMICTINTYTRIYNRQ